MGVNKILVAKNSIIDVEVGSKYFSQSKKNPT